MLNALLYGPNPKFDDFIEKIKYDIDSVIVLNNDMLYDDLATSVFAKYNNMVASDKYYKLDPKYSKIFALTKTSTVLK